LVNSFLDVDKSVISTAKDVQRGTKTINDLESSVNQASPSTATFAATLKTVAINMAIMFTIDLAIKAVTKAKSIIRYPRYLGCQANLLFS